ncbi:unnamed protein product [Nesidiocoris tenuis]|uniref:MADF domain-containing protein n=1 Tax=Nesidiocoris tenuis TaxID=355587 RepID=A0A6H5G582_9HEMI|nr:unnamed protein product [Nesidiocoris tenuis]
MDSMDDDTIIGEIKKRPCLWDTHDLHYKDREKKRNAWIQVTKAVLGSKFTKITDEEKNEIGKLSFAWRNSTHAHWHRWSIVTLGKQASTAPEALRAEKDESNDQDDSQDHEGSGDDVSADDTPKGAMAGRGRKSQAQAQPKPTPTMTKTPRRVPGNDDFERQLWELFQKSPPPRVQKTNDRFGKKARKRNPGKLQSRESRIARSKRNSRIGRAGQIQPRMVTYPQKKKKKTEPLKVKIEDEAQLMTKSRRSVIPTKFSEYVMLIDSSENDSSDGYSSADNTSSVDLPAAKPAVKRPGRRRRIDESADDSSDAQRRPAKSRRKYMTIKERIKLLKRFDALQPCSPTEAADIFGMNSESFSIIVDERDDLESRFADSGKSFLPKEDLETLKEALVDFAKRNESNKATLTSAELKTKAEELKQSLNLSEIEVSKEWIDTWKADYETCRKELVKAENSARLGTELSNLVVTSQKNGVELSMDEIKIKCQALKDSLGITDVDVTDEWLTEWKKKSGKPAKRPYRSRKSPSSFICANEEIIDDWSGAVRAALINYHPDDIFNAVESGIYFKSLPGLNNSQTDWMTVFFACNMSGIEKKQLLVIGKSTNQLSLGILTLPVDFASNENAWMTAEIFTSFVTDWDRRAGQSRRRIALIVEESPVHPRVDLSWIELFFVPKNVCNLPPLKRGVISLVKNLYRKELLKAVKKLAPDSRQIESTVEKISVIDAAFMLSSAWAEVDKSSMVTAFVHSGFPFLRKPSLRAGGENEEHPDESRLVTNFIVIRVK